MSDEEVLNLVRRRFIACPAFRSILFDAADRQRRVEAALKMLRSRMPRSEIVSALRDRFGISRTKAYLDVEAALNLIRENSND